MVTKIPADERLKSSNGIVAYFVKHTADMSEEDKIRKIYNMAIDDAVDALKVYAEKNPQYRGGLEATADEIETNWPLINRS